jgi:hypothetical protein
MPKPPNGSHAYTNGVQSKPKGFSRQTEKSPSNTDNITDSGLNFEGRFNSSPHGAHFSILLRRIIYSNYLADVSEFFIPSFAGLGSAAGQIQRRFLRAYGSAIAMVSVCFMELHLQFSVFLDSISYFLVLDSWP